MAEDSRRVGLTGFFFSLCWILDFFPLPLNFSLKLCGKKEDKTVESQRLAVC